MTTRPPQANPVGLLVRREHPHGYPRPTSAPHTVEAGATRLYRPRGKSGDAARVGQTVTVVKASKPGTKHPSARVRFPDGHEMRVPVRSLARDVYKERDEAAPELDTLLDDARARPSYGRLVRAAADVLAQGSARAEDDEDAARAATARLARAELDLPAASGRLARTLAPRHAPADLTAFARRIEAALVADALDLSARRARAAKPARPPERPERLGALQWARLTAEAKREINLIARAVSREYIVPEDRPEEPEPRQPRRDSLEALMRQEGRAAFAAARQCAMAQLAGNAELASAYAHEFAEHDARYADARRFLDREPARQRTGRVHRGVIYEIREPQCDEHGDLVGHTRRFFNLVLVWDKRGSGIQVANSVEIEERSGIDVGEDGWRDFVRWVEHHDKRLAGAARGRPADPRALVFRDHSGGLETRRSILDTYPGALRAFEALRHTLTHTPEEYLGDLRTIAPEELQWQDDDDEDEAEG